MFRSRAVRRRNRDLLDRSNFLIASFACTVMFVASIRPCVLRTDMRKAQQYKQDMTDAYHPKHNSCAPTDLDPITFRRQLSRVY